MMNTRSTEWIERKSCVSSNLVQVVCSSGVIVKMFTDARSDVCSEIWRDVHQCESNLSNERQHGRNFALLVHSERPAGNGCYLVTMCLCCKRLHCDISSCVVRSCCILSPCACAHNWANGRPQVCRILSNVTLPWWRRVPTWNHRWQFRFIKLSWKSKKCQIIGWQRPFWLQLIMPLPHSFPR